MSESINDLDLGFEELALAGQMDSNAAAEVANNPRYEGDENLWVKFFIHPHPNIPRTQKEGRPIYDDREYVEIIVPGDRNNTVNRPVREIDKQRFPKQYAAFKTGAEQQVSGTPLSHWPAMTRSQVEELKYYKIVTVEQLSAMPDNLAQMHMGLNTLRQKAQRYLEASNSSSYISKMDAELSERDNRIAALENSMGELVELLKKSKVAGKDEALEAANAALEPAEITDPDVTTEDDDELEDER